MTFSLNFGSLLAVRVGDYCVGDGVANDYAGLTQAISVAGTTQALVFQPGKTYLVGTCVVFPSTLKIIGNGAKIIKSASLNDYAARVTGANVQMVDLNIDGNRAGGNTNNVGCLRWDGAGGVAEHVKATNGKAVGIYVQGSGVLDAYECEGSDIVSGTSSGDGFQVAVGGLLRTWDCTANSNGRSGFRFVGTAADGCRLDGTANNNLLMGAEILSNNGTCGNFYADNNEGFGVYALGVTGWSFDYVEANDTGAAIGGIYTFNGAGTAVELYGSTRCHFSTVVARRNPGYGVALTANAGTGCTYCSFGDVYVESGADPAFHISGSSKWNTVTSLIAVGGTMAVLRLEAASHNTFGRVIATDCHNTAPFTWTSLFSCVAVGTACSYNTVHFWQSENPATTPPAYIMKCDATAAHNWIFQGFSRNYGTGVLSDANGTNVATLTAPI